MLHLNKRAGPTYSLVGATGFLGLNIQRQGGDAITRTYDSKTVSDLSRAQHDVIICAAPSAVKHLANKEPEKDRATVRELARLLTKCAASGATRLVLIGTIDVYGDTQIHDPTASEATEPAPSCPYGDHRRELETLCHEAYGDRLVVLRLPALFGPGLKKNYLFDLLHCHRLEFVDRGAAFPFYDVANIWADIKRFERGSTTINLFPAPVRMDDVIRQVFPDLSDRVTEDTQRVAYRVASVHYRGPSPAETVRAIGAWAAAERVRNRLYLSQLAIDGPLATSSLRGAGLRRGAGGLTFVPCLNGTWADFSEWARFDVVHAQSLCFGVEAEFLSAEMLAHWRFLCASVFPMWPNLRTLTFGTPRSRQVCDIPAIVARLREMGTLLATTAPRATLCLENNPEQYQARWGTTPPQCADIVRAVGRANVRITFDLGCAEMAANNPAADVPRWLAECLRDVAHVHVSRPQIAPVENDDLPSWYIECIGMIRDDADITLEQKGGDPKAAVDAILSAYIQ